MDKKRKDTNTILNFFKKKCSTVPFIKNNEDKEVFSTVDMSYEVSKL